MRRDVQEIFRATPHEKQVMMFSATLSKDIRMQDIGFMPDIQREGVTIDNRLEDIVCLNSFIIIKRKSNIAKIIPPSKLEEMKILLS